MDLGRVDIFSLVTWSSSVTKPKTNTLRDGPTVGALQDLVVDLVENRN